MTYKLLLTLAMSVIVLVGCGGSEDAGRSKDVDTPETKRMINFIRRDTASVTAHQVQDLLDRGASANAKIRTPEGFSRYPLLLIAGNNENLEVIPVILALLKAGADVDARDSVGMSALMYAASSNENPEVISVLLKAGADVKAKSNIRQTSLMHAASSNENPEVISVLLEAGADVNAQDQNGCSPLISAARWNTNSEVISVLLKAGADADLIDQGGRIALDSAQNRWDTFEGTQALKELEEATNQ